MVLALLLSPVTWLQHLVLMMPALYLIVAEDRGVKKLGKAAPSAMWAYVVLSLVLNRELLGRETYLLLLSYHTHTLGMLLVLGGAPVGTPRGNDHTHEYTRPGRFPAALTEPHQLLLS